MTAVGEQLRRGSLRADLAAVEDHHARADILDVGEQVRGQQDGLAAAAELEDEVLHLPRADRVEARGRLVEDEQLGVVHQRLRESEPARHALRELARRAVRDLGEADHLEQFVGAAPARAAVEPEELAVVVERLGRVEEPVEVGLLGQVSDLALHRDVARVAAEDHQLAARLVQQAEDHLDGGRLARAVRPEQSEDLVPVDVEVDAVHGARGVAHPEVAEGLGQAGGLDDAFFGCSLGIRHRSSSVRSASDRAPVRARVGRAGGSSGCARRCGRVRVGAPSAGPSVRAFCQGLAFSAPLRSTHRA